MTRVSYNQRKRELDQSTVKVDIRSRIGKVLFPSWYCNGMSRGRTKQRKRFLVMLQIKDLEIKQTDQIVFYVNTSSVVTDAIIIPAHPHAPRVRILTNHVKRFIPNSCDAILVPEFGAWTHVY